MDPTTSDSASAQQTWRVCPVCKRPNPADVLHCQHCWGASLYQIAPVDSDELLRIMERTERRSRRRRLAKIISVSVLAPAMLIAAVVLALYSFTDLIVAPTPGMNSDSASGEWAMFRGDLSRTGRVDAIGPQPRGELKWKFQTGAPVRSSPALAYGTIYVGSRDFSLYALDAETGQKKWEFQTENRVESSPTVAGGVVYFGSNDGYLYAVDAFTGQERWRFYTRFPIQSSVAVADGKVYFGSSDYSVYSLDAATGDKVWQFETGSVVASSPVVADGILYVGSMDFSLYALQADNGRLRLRMRTWEVSSSPAVHDGVVYFNSRGRLYAIDGSARNWPGEHRYRGWWFQLYAFRLAPQPPPVSGVLWSLSMPPLNLPTSAGADASALSTVPGWSIASSTSPVVYEGMVYTTFDSMVYAIDAVERKHVWTSVTGATISSSPALGDGVIYVGSGDGNLYALDTRDGHQLWAFPTGDGIASSPLLANGVVYVGSHDGAIYAIK